MTDSCRVNYLITRTHNKTRTRVKSFFEKFFFNRPRAWRVISTISPPKLPKRSASKLIEVMPAETKLKRKGTSSEQTRNTNVTSLFVCVLSDRAIAFWTKSYLAGVRWGTSPPWGPPLPYEQALTILFARLLLNFRPFQNSTVPRSGIAPSVMQLPFHH